MFVIRAVGGVQRSVWGSDDSDPLRSSSREFQDNRVQSSKIIEPRVSRSLILLTRTWRVSCICIDLCFVAGCQRFCLFDVCVAFVSCL